MLMGLNLQCQVVMMSRGEVCRSHVAPHHVLKCGCATYSGRVKVACDVHIPACRSVFVQKRYSYEQQVVWGGRKARMYREGFGRTAVACKTSQNDVCPYCAYTISAEVTFNAAPLPLVSAIFSCLHSHNCDRCYIQISALETGALSIS